ncbi:PFL_4669 family integrating conjugative element protein [Vibrio sp. TBV020]|uniref:PFL_4669 family integrating conjugative element protein n=1 Tax=Vibrio sp. TBV020 TaxID=3137398 RepID=UPI0038CDBF06
MDKKANKKQSGIGSLTADAQLEIHSVETVQLWSPSKKKGVPSVPRWLQAVSTLEHAARKDDPYADFALLEIERALNDAFAHLHHIMDSMPSLISSRLRFSQAQSSQPLVKELRIGSRFGWRLVALLEVFDVLMVRLFDAQFKAQLTRQQFEQHRRSSKQVMRHALQLGEKLRHSGITRQDMATNNAKAIEAQKKLGELPLEVVEGLERAEFAPAIKSVHG